LEARFTKISQNPGFKFYKSKCKHVRRVILKVHKKVRRVILKVHKKGSWVNDWYSSSYSQIYIYIYYNLYHVYNLYIYTVMRAPYPNSWGQ
jgi:hypothetical protein